MSKLVKIRLTQGRTGPAGTTPAGQVVSIDAETAARYVNAQQAEYIKEEKVPVRKSTNTTTVKKATKPTRNTRNAKKVEKEQE